MNHHDFEPNLTGDTAALLIAAILTTLAVVGVAVAALMIGA